jgi:hypothetical protein
MADTDGLEECLRRLAAGDPAAVPRRSWWTARHDLEGEVTPADSRCAIGGGAGFLIF